MKTANQNESQSRLRAHGGFGPHIFFAFFLKDKNCRDKNCRDKNCRDKKDWTKKNKKDWKKKNKKTTKKV